MSDNTTKNQCKNWCFTINNYTDEELAFAKSFGENECSYCVFGVELGANLTPHLQGYLQLKTKLRLTGLKKAFIQRGHYEAARGTPEENRVYCTKAGSFFEFGTMVTPGSRRDFHQLGAAIVAGTTVAEIAVTDPAAYIRYHRGLTSLAQIIQKPRDFKTEVHWYYGPTGTGKSKLASEENPSAYWKKPSNKWWCGYNGENVIIDDFRRDFCTFSELLRLFDRYPLFVETKGGSAQFRSARITITTPKSPIDTWEGRTEEDIEQLLRRIEVVKHFPKSIFDKH